MLDGIFKTPKALLLSDKSPVWVDIMIGDSGTASKYVLIKQATLTQSFRTAYNTSLDGTAYVTDAGRGLGTYTFTILDGPYQDCTPNSGNRESFLKKYTNMKSLDNRRITIVLKNSVFEGYIQKVQISTVDNNDLVCDIVDINAVGDWL